MTPATPTSPPLLAPPHRSAPAQIPLQSLPTAALVLDAGGTVIDCNHAATQLFERSDGELRGIAATRLFGDDPIASGITPSVGTSVRIPLSHGRHVEMFALIGLLESSVTGRQMLVLLTPTTASTESHELHVPPTRSVDEVARMCSEHDGALLCVAIGLIGMSAVNAVFGCRIGDLVLAQVCTKLHAACGPQTMIERIEDGRLVVIMRSGHEDPVSVNRIMWAACEPLVSPLGEVVVGHAAGVAVGDAGTTVELLQRAEHNLELAIQRGAGTVEWNDKLPHRLPTPPRPAPREEGATVVKGSIVGFQPVVSMTTGDIVEYEAFSRWRSPDSMPLTTAQRVLLARSSSPAALDNVLFDAAVEFLAQLTSLDPTTAVRISMDVTVRQLCAPSFCSKLFDGLERASVSPASIQLELSDRFDKLEQPALTRTTNALREHGVRLALDDFGRDAGDLCTLGYVQFDAIKLEPRFTTHAEDMHGENLLRSVLRLAGQVGIETIAKGVDSPEHHERLARDGCMFGQGKLYGQHHAHRR